MGVPKKLTEMQRKFAHELVTNEGRKYGYECAIEAGYEKNRSRQTAYELQNPKLFVIYNIKNILKIKYNKTYYLLIPISMMWISRVIF